MSCLVLAVPPKESKGEKRGGIPPHSPIEDQCQNNKNPVQPQIPTPSPKIEKENKKGGNLTSVRQLLVESCTNSRICAAI